MSKTTDGKSPGSAASKEMAPSVQSVKDGRPDGKRTSSAASTTPTRAVRTPSAASPAGKVATHKAASINKTTRSPNPTRASTPKHKQHKESDGSPSQRVKKSDKAIQDNADPTGRDRAEQPAQQVTKKPDALMQDPVPTEQPPRAMQSWSPHEDLPPIDWERLLDEHRQQVGQIEQEERQVWSRMARLSHMLEAWAVAGQNQEHERGSKRLRTQVEWAKNEEAKLAKSHQHLLKTREAVQTALRSLDSEP